jgi:hypothetical protein
MRQKNIEVTVSPDGDIKIEAVCFTGSDCESATKYLEEALGIVGKRNRKREYYSKLLTKNQQKLGS